MPRYRIYYLKETQRQHFRNAPPVPGPLKLKLKDYQEGGEIEASSPYSAWKQLKDTAERRPIEVGDALATDTGSLYVCRWAGFEEAQWYLPEPPPMSQTPTEPPAAMQ